MSDELIELPEGWSIEELEGLCIFNPKHDSDISDSTEISFVPMAALDGKSGTIQDHEHKQLGELRKGYTHFAEGDVIFAKITPCMENGKSAVAKHLINGLACGSTEFYVLRSYGVIVPNFLHFFLRQRRYLEIAAGATTGVVGQRRLPKEFLLKTKIPLPPLNEQKRIVAKIEELNDRTQRAKEALETIPQLCDRFRQSVLAAAFRGDLTADWREQNPDVEPASVLLERIRRDRQQNYYQEIEELKLEGKNLPKLAYFQEIAIDLDIPASWISISVESACIFIVDCLHSTPKFMDEGEYCIDTTCIEPFKINWDKARKVSTEDFTIRTSRMVPRQNDILFSREGTIGTAVRVPNSPKLCLGQRMMMFRFSPQILPEYAELYLQSAIFQEQYKSLILGTTSPHLNIGDIRKLAFIVPPLAEQRQILQQASSLLKVNVLIGQQDEKLQTYLDKLNQSILAKAFRGELVPQDPDDEPASELLERIRAEREKLNNGKQKSQRTSKRKSKTVEEQGV